MTKSRKLIIVAFLLAGGYGLALFLSGLTDLVGPSTVANDETAAANRGFLTTLKRLVPNRKAAAGTGQLVPDAEAADGDAESVSSAPRQAFARPTWLAATPQTNLAEVTTGRLDAAAIPAFTESGPTAPAANGESSLAGPPRLPSARITNVTTTLGSPASNSASAWDRWPRWEPTTADATRGTVAATFETSEPTKPQAMTVSFDGFDAAHERQAAADVGDARTHVLVDGDSLAKLADRYLDDPELDDEIFRLNRDVLTSPDLLPIGVELRIPDGRMADSHRAAPSPRRNGVGQSSVPAGMVPVEWTPQTFNGVPRAELLRPIPAGRSD